MSQTDHQETIGKIRELIGDIKFAMLTTETHDGVLRSRPMKVQEFGFDGELWFFTSENTGKVYEIREHQQVNVSLADPDDHQYVSLSGPAFIERDRSKMEKLWSPIYQAWFPQGLDTPDLILLRIPVEHAEYWDTTSGKMLQLAGLV